MSGPTDRELLEGAAMAAGIGPVIGYAAESGNLIIGPRSNFRYWNPRVDDGQALRLAAKLGLVVSTDSRAVYAQTIPGITPSAYASQGGPDQMANIRLCIVRAAYEIGSAKP